MNGNLQQKLYSDFPTMFDNIHKSPMESPMAFGIETGDGWYDIIRSVCWMSKQHEDNIRWQTEWKQKEEPEYKSEYFPIKFDQIKEKYGGLRIYFSGGDDYIEGLISMAEAISYKICEICGNKGEPNEGGWISTRCEAHRNS